MDLSRCEGSSCKLEEDLELSDDEEQSPNAYFGASSTIRNEDELLAEDDAEVAGIQVQGNFEDVVETINNPNNDNDQNLYIVDQSGERVQENHGNVPSGNNVRPPTATASYSMAGASLFQHNDASVAGNTDWDDGRDLVEYDDLDLNVDELGQPGQPENIDYIQDRRYDLDQSQWNRKKVRVDPRDRTSRDEINRQKEREHLGRLESPTPIQRTPRRNKPENEREQQKQANKLQQGLRAIMEEEVQPGALEEQAEAGDIGETSPPRWTQDPWNSVLSLTKRGYAISWYLKKLKQEDNLPLELSQRVFKCVVTYNDLTGVCEAASSNASRQGAAIDFLRKFVVHYPTGGRYSYPTSVDEGFLIPEDICQVLTNRLKELYPQERVELRFQINVDRRVHHSNAYTAVLTIGTQTYEGTCTHSAKLAKFKAAKMAYEDLLQEPCPMIQIFQGVAECTTDESLYFGIQSETYHCYDFGRVTMLEPGNFRQTGSGRYYNNQGHGTGFRGGRRVLVSFEKPEGN